MIKKIKPKKGQESVWDYPRPPAVEEFKGSIKIVFNKEVILVTDSSYRVLETSHPPTYYLPIDQFKTGVLIENPKVSMCEYKGVAKYYDIVVEGKVAQQSAWQYPEAQGNFSCIQRSVAVYAHMMDACFVNDMKVNAQEGSFYGGWITPNIVGPFKGGSGTWGW